MLNSYNKNIIMVIIVIAVLFSQFTMAGIAGESSQGELVIYHAGSLTIPVANLKEAFRELHPDLEIKSVAGGSRKIARLVAETGQKADILMSADYTVIDTLLIPDHADWNILFAENSMVVMYTDESKYADKINEENWYEILTREGVEYGHSEPDMDPCGYRSVLLFQLAENYYQQEGLNQALLDNCPQKNIRPKSVELISLLETGALDYAFEYESVALQHQIMDDKFKYIKLPAAINLSSIEYADDYAQATVELSGTEPGQTVTKKGQPIVYGVTMPFNGENRDNAIAFMQFLLDQEKGLKVIREAGQPTHQTKAVTGKDKIPAALINLVD